MEKVNQKVLPLKYRPRHWNSLIGPSASIMAKTITNSIKLNKLPTAYLLTGIHGTGKTTTARLIACAINCKKNFVEGEECNPKEYCSCREIRDSKMLDCQEVDGATATGIDSIRELIDSSRYAPTSAKYKVVILDEAHQISRAAMSGLLKSLEETPPKFLWILATTEPKKIPPTILSRVQRFDLHPVPISDLLEHLKKIAKLENGKISEGVLKLLAKACGGSVRDGLSMLQRVLIEEQEVDETFVRKNMLGIGDRSKILSLLNFIFQGEQKKSIDLLREIVNEGVLPTNFLNDLLEVIYFIQQKKFLGNFDSELSLSESEQDTINSISKDVDMTTLILFWQIILASIDELKIISNPILSLEMTVVRLLHIKGDAPSYEKILNSLKENNSNETDEFNDTSIAIKNEKKIINDENQINKISKDQIKNTLQAKPELGSTNPKKLIEEKNLEHISSFEDLIKLSSIKKEVELKHDLEKNVNLIKFSEGKIDIGFNENLGKNFVRSLSEKLLTWTGKRWLITLTKASGQKTFSERQSIMAEQLLEKEKKGEVCKKFKNIFPDGELIEILKKD